MERNDQERLKEDRTRSRVIVFRCSDSVYEDVLDYIRMSGRCFMVYTKTSTKKIMVSEEDWPF